MLDDQGFEIFEQNEFPLAYLITFRTYGTWLHGDDRSSFQRQRKTATESKRISPNIPLHERMADEMKQSAILLSLEQRKAVEDAIKDLCHQREYGLYAVNVLTNHVHSVVSVLASPERVADALKAFATKRLRELDLIGVETTVWSRGRSRVYLWKPRHVDAAVEYVLYGQGDLPFELQE